RRQDRRAAHRHEPAPLPGHPRHPPPQPRQRLRDPRDQPAADDRPRGEPWLRARPQRGHRQALRDGARAHAGLHLLIRRPRRAYPRRMVLVAGLLVFAAATAGLALLVEPIPTWYYHLAWWSYILAADDLNHRISGSSLMRDHPRRFLWLAGVSVAWWTLFEAINLRLGNWYYVMDPPSRALRWAGGVVAFATVLPGIVETLGLVENLAWARSVRVAPLRWTRGKEAVCVAFGAACFALPLA